MDNERMIHPLKIALACYDRRELRVQKRFLEEEGPAITCTCFQSGEYLLAVLRQDTSFDVVIVCGELADMTALEFLAGSRALETRPILLLFDDAKRKNESALCVETEKGVYYVGQADLKSLLRQLYQMPGQQGQRMERQCRELYESWGLQPSDVNCGYLTCAVSVVMSSSQKMAIRKEILQTVGQQFGVSVSAVDSGIRRMIDQLEAAPSEAWQTFKEESGFAADKLTTGKLIYAVKNQLRRQKEP